MLRLFNCQICKKESVANYAGKKFCSRSCMGKRNSTMYRKAHPCACGCGEIVQTSSRKYVGGHYRPSLRDIPRGESNPLWKGGWINKIGYHCQTVYIDGKKKTMLTHRLIMEKHIGRKLEKGEVVDHIDGNKSNNDISNLRLCKNNRQNTHYYWGITEQDIKTIEDRVKQGLTLRKCYEGTNVKSCATVIRIRERMAS